MKILSLICRLSIWPYLPSLYVNLCTLDHDNSSCTILDRATRVKIPRPVMACRSSWYSRDISLGTVIGYRPKEDVRSGLFVDLLHGDKCYMHGKEAYFAKLPHLCLEKVPRRCDAVRCGSFFWKFLKNRFWIKHIQKGNTILQSPDWAVWVRALAGDKVLWSWVRIPFRPEFFSGFNLTTVHNCDDQSCLTCLSTVQIYDLSYILLHQDNLLSHWFSSLKNINGYRIVSYRQI